VREFLDRRGFWIVLSYTILALLVFWLFRLNARVNDSVKETRDAVQSNTDAIAFLCDTNAVVEALAEQTIVLLRSEPSSAERVATIHIFQGYARTLRDRRPCVKAERAALP
jgi:hypothetical protein